MNSVPLVSIIVPCYNQAQYLPETLQSISEQDLDDWECIIVNDGSPDNTEEVANEWCKKDKRFRYIKKENGGLSDARNYGIKKSSGIYILPLDSDDKISDKYTKEAISILEENPEVKVVYSKAMMFGLEQGEWHLLPYSYENMLFVRNCIHCSGIYRRSDYDKTIGYNPNMRKGWEDYDFWLTLIKKNDIVVRLEDFHFFYRTKRLSMRTEISENIERELRLQIFRNHENIYLEYINPIEMYNDLKRMKLITDSMHYRLIDSIIKPFRCICNLFKRKGNSDGFR